MLLVAGAQAYVATQSTDFWEKVIATVLAVIGALGYTAQRTNLKEKVIDATLAAALAGSLPPAVVKPEVSA